MQRPTTIICGVFILLFANVVAVVVAVVVVVAATVNLAWRYRIIKFTEVFVLFAVCFANIDFAEAPFSNAIDFWCSLPPLHSSKCQ